jgi:hypothetical protein
LGLSISLREWSDSITIITLQTIGTVLYYRGNYDDMVVERREERYYIIDDGIVLLGFGSGPAQTHRDSGPLPNPS